MPPRHSWPEYLEIGRRLQAALPAGESLTAGALRQVAGGGHERAEAVITALRIERGEDTHLLAALPPGLRDVVRVPAPHNALPVEVGELPEALVRGLQAAADAARAVIQQARTEARDEVRAAQEEHERRVADMAARLEEAAAQADAERGAATEALVEHERLQGELRTRLATATADVERLTGALDQTRGLLATAEGEAATHGDVARRVQEELVRVTAARDELQRAVERQQRDLDRAHATAASQEAALREGAERAARAEAAAAAAAAQVSELRAQVGALTRERAEAAAACAVAEREQARLTGALEASQREQARLERMLAEGRRELAVSQARQSQSGATRAAKRNGRQPREMAGGSEG